MRSAGPSIRPIWKLEAALKCPIMQERTLRAAVGRGNASRRIIERSFPTAIRPHAATRFLDQASEGSSSATGVIITSRARGRRLNQSRRHPPTRQRIVMTSRRIGIILGGAKPIGGG
jgi:hypothetical protein